MSTIRPVRICLLLGLSAALAAAQQTQPEAPVGMAKLRDFETTYQAGLVKIQTPLLTDYALKLQQLIATIPLAEQAAVQAELDRVKKLAATGGIIDLRSASATQARVTAPPGGARTPPGAVLVFKPDTAKGPAVLGGAITIGKAEWAVAQLDAGNYEVSVVCSHPAFTGTASITASLGSAEATGELSPSDAVQFRLLRLGRFHFDEDVRDQDLKVELKSTDLPGVQIRQVFISKPRPPK